MLGIEPSTQRRRMDEALEAIMALLRCDGPVTRRTDWFEMHEARLHLRPYSDPHFPIAVASTLTPAGLATAGRHGVGILSLGAGMPAGPPRCRASGASRKKKRRSTARPGPPRLAHGDERPMSRNPTSVPWNRSASGSGPRR
jgi:alkanesulfonate monooxygenase SsuD/methylene tetrahydromethanopterin reductase-like flavin-dependent oxidoreductase (luciferase family)